MDSGSIIVKAYLENPGQTQPEIRRFNLEEGASTNFEYLNSKLASIYPSLSPNSYQITWKDEEGDFVAIGSDEELIQALLFGRPEGLLRLYLRTSEGGPNPGFSASSGNASEPGGVEHPGVVCDGCNGAVRGIRFKCMVCPDFDLCQGCCAKGLHNHHYMLRMSEPASDWTRPCGGRQGANRGGWWWPGFYGANRHGAWNPRRFWKQFAGGQQQQQQPGSASGDASGGPDCQQQQQQQACGGATKQQKEFLEQIGQHFSTFLEPFGIEVDVEERPGESRRRCRRNNKCKPDPNCRKNCASAAATSGASEAPPTSSSAAGHQEPTAEPQSSSAASAEAKNMEKDLLAAAGDGEGVASESEKKQMETEVDGDESSWIKVEPKAEDMDVIVLEVTPTQSSSAAGAAAVPSAPPATVDSSASSSVPAYTLYPSLTTETSARPKQPSPPTSRRSAPDMPTTNQATSDLDVKVSQAVEQMKAMGFHDEGGWMTAMLYDNNGEIYRVIDAVLKKAHKKA